MVWFIWVKTLVSSSNLQSKSGQTPIFWVWILNLGWALTAIFSQIHNSNQLLSNRKVIDLFFLYNFYFGWFSYFWVPELWGVKRHLTPLFSLFLPGQISGHHAATVLMPIGWNQYILICIVHVLHPNANIISYSNSNINFICELKYRFKFWI